MQIVKMQFNSYIFILLFLPSTIVLYFLANKVNHVIGKLLIIVASLIFYAYTDWKPLIILGISIILNYIFSRLISKRKEGVKIYVLVPVLINVCLLLYFKYFNFIASNICQILDKEFVWGGVLYYR